MATAVSKVNNKIWVIISPVRIIPEARAVWLPSRVISKCPATMFAINRTDSVIGRIKFLIDSINTIKGISPAGVPLGTIWANIWVVLFTHPYTIKASHRGRANPRVRVRCLDEVKIYGNKPIKLLVKIKKNKVVNSNVAPEVTPPPSKVLNSL